MSRSGTFSEQDLHFSGICYTIVICGSIYCRAYRDILEDKRCLENSEKLLGVLSPQQS